MLSGGWAPAAAGLGPSRRETSSGVGSRPGKAPVPGKGVQEFQTWV